MNISNSNLKKILYLFFLSNVFLCSCNPDFKNSTDNTTTTKAFAHIVVNNLESGQPIGPTLDGTTSPSCDMTVTVQVLKNNIATTFFTKIYTFNHYQIVQQSLINFEEFDVEVPKTGAFQIVCQLNYSNCTSSSHVCVNQANNKSTFYAKHQYIQTQPVLNAAPGIIAFLFSTTNWLKQDCCF